ncbi:MAG: uracil-DNA glycosylase [Proteobacteria bacterium]|nr:uracil-DNA glycosylase [Pseudomonadota bacterium]
MDSKDIDCKKCRHYYITWDRKFPYGCKAIQFKSAMAPSLEVFAASGIACLRFEEKTIKPQMDKK